MKNKMKKIISTFIIVSYLVVFTPSETLASLDFNGATGDKVRIPGGAVTELDNMTVGTIIQWIRPNTTAPSANRKLYEKGNGSAGFLFLRMNATGNLDVSMDYTDTDPISSTASFFKTDTWQFLAVTFNATSDQPRIYTGTTTALATEVTYSGTPTAGSGSRVSDAIHSLSIGARDDIDTQSFPGKIAFTAVWNRVLTLGEIRQQQFSPHVTSGCILFMNIGFGSSSGLGTQPDYSGKRNNGTVVGTPKMSPHVPLRNPFGF